MSVFVDTSALLAVLDAGDRFHPQAAAGWQELVEGGELLLTSSYVLVESFALVQSRLGTEASRTLDRDLCPMIEVVWVDQTLHRSAVTAFLTAARRRLSLVDCASFEVMRQRGMTRAFAFDRHFTEQGFTTI